MTELPSMACSASQDRLSIVESLSRITCAMHLSMECPPSGRAIYLRPSVISANRSRIVRCQNRAGRRNPSRQFARTRLQGAGPPESRRPHFSPGTMAFFRSRRTAAPPGTGHPAVWDTVRHAPITVCFYYCFWRCAERRGRNFDGPQRAAVRVHRTGRHDAANMINSTLSSAMAGSEGAGERFFIS